MKFVSYWENAPGRSMPAYVALSLAWSRHVLGQDFLLLTPRTVLDCIGHDHLRKHWRFQQLPFEGDAAVLSVVAKSDFIRMAYVLQHGGVWVDADSIVLPALAPLLADLQDGRLHWYSEALFGAAPGHSLLRRAVQACLAGGEQEWANPGSIRQLLAEQPRLVKQIPYAHLDPGYRPQYRFETCDVMLCDSLSVPAFLRNPELKLLKLYNTYFSRSALGCLDIESFLQSDLLLARVFLHLHPEPAFWLTRGHEVMDEALTGA